MQQLEFIYPELSTISILKGFQERLSKLHFVIDISRMSNKCDRIRENQLFSEKKEVFKEKVHYTPR